MIPGPAPSPSEAGSGSSADGFRCRFQPHRPRGEQQPDPLCRGCSRLSPRNVAPRRKDRFCWRGSRGYRLLDECIHRVEQETGCDSARPGLRHAGVVVSKPPPPSVAKSVSTMRLYEAWNAVDCGGPYPGRMLGDIMRCLRRAPARAQPPGAPRARRRDRCAPSSPGSRARVSLRQSPGPRPCRAGGPRASARSHARTP